MTRKEFSQTLNPEQFEFMQKFGIIFTLDGFHHRITGERSPLLDLLLKSDTYIALFGDMSIDDLLDRHSSTEGYTWWEYSFDLWDILRSSLPEKKTTEPTYEGEPFDFSEEGIRKLKGRIRNTRNQRPSEE